MSTTQPAEPTEEAARERALSADDYTDAVTERGQEIIAQAQEQLPADYDTTDALAAINAVLVMRVACLELEMKVQLEAADERFRSLEQRVYDMGQEAKGFARREGR